MTSVLVVGAGSAGRRHARNLHAAGCEIGGMDPRADRLEELAADVGELVVSASDLDAALAHRFDAVVVASPPAFHVAQALAALDAGAAVLLEKPASVDAASCAPLVAHPDAGRILLGYTYRWWPPIRLVRHLLAADRIGRVLHVDFTMAAHLADWHPWEAYQDFFMAHRELGGGALLDESHVIDLAIWFFGMPTSVWGVAERLGELEIDSDDSVDASWTVEGGPRITVHLDLYARPHRRTIEIRGTSGTIEWSFAPHVVRVHDEAGVEEHESEIDRNEMFVAVAAELLDVVAGAAPSCTVADGVRALAVVDAIRRSEGRTAEEVRAVDG